jgi:glycosyltransferase involved in cell wall biosynthesis
MHFPVSNFEGRGRRMEICLIIPAYNAEKSILAVVHEALATGLPLLVVDDGSTDATAAVVRKLPLTIVSHPRNLGKGMALRTGFDWTLSRGFDGAVTLDADGQHEVAAVRFLADSARSRGIDILIASRFSQFEEMAGLRSYWNRFGVWCLQKRTGFTINDSQSGFRYYSAALLRQLRLESTGYDLEMEILLKAWRGRFVIGSVPIAARVADGRATSHYRPVRDTWNICMTFLRYM